MHVGDGHTWRSSRQLTFASRLAVSLKEEARVRVHRFFEVEVGSVPREPFSATTNRQLCECRLFVHGAKSVGRYGQCDTYILATGFGGGSEKPIIVPSGART